MEISEAELKVKIDAAVLLATEGLQNKNTAVIGKQKALKTALAVFDGLDIETITAQATELAKLKESNLTDEERRANADAANATNLANAQTSLVDANTTIAKMSKDNAVDLAILKAGAVNEGMGEAVSGLLKAKTTMNAEGKPVIGDVAVDEYVTAWKKEEGKVFFIPPNSGTGAGGDGGEGASDYAKFFDKNDKSYNLTEQVKLSKKNPPLYKQLKSAA